MRVPLAVFGLGRLEALGHTGLMGLPSGMVTLLFTDVEGGIGLWEADPEAMAEAAGRHNRMGRLTGSSR